MSGIIKQPEPNKLGEPVFPYVLKEMKDLYESKPHLLKLMVKDYKGKVKQGFEKYKTVLRLFDGRSTIKDLYQELIDATFYCKKKLMELEVELEADGIDYKVLSDINTHIFMFIGYIREMIEDEDALPSE